MEKRMVEEIKEQRDITLQQYREAIENRRKEEREE
jgi:hypothetical protein